MKAASKTARIKSLRRFFRCLQKYSYEVDGRTEPRLEINWNPDDALATPEHVIAQVQPNPRNVEEEAWLKLVWTACTLNAEMVKEAAPGARYPVHFLRSLALVWVTGCRRSDEIRRLPLECVRQEWAPEMVDENGVQLEPAEKLWYLRVPHNKYKVMRDYLSKVNPPHVLRRLFSGFGFGVDIRLPQRTDSCRGGPKGNRWPLLSALANNELSDILEMTWAVATGPHHAHESIPGLLLLVVGHVQGGHSSQHVPC